MAADPLAAARSTAARGGYGRVAAVPPSDAERYASLGGSDGGPAAPGRLAGRVVVPRGRLYALAGLGSLVLVVALGVTLRPAATSAAAADDGCAYAGYRLQPVAAPAGYSISVRPEFAPPFRFAGAVTIDLTLTAGNQRCLQLHALDLTVANASLVLPGGAPGAPAEPLAVLAYDALNERVVLSLGARAPFAPGTRLLLSVGFNGTLRDDNVGLYRSTYRDDAGAEVHVVTTQFEATFARRAWPCFDEPAYKATYNMTVDGVPAGYTALSNMPPAATVANADGTTRVSFQQLQRMSSYLVALVVAPLVASSASTPGGLNVTAWGVDRANNSARLAFARDVAVAVIPFYEQLFGIRFPLPKMDMVAVPDFAAGAMENVGCVIYRETALFSSNASTQAELQRVAGVVAHEIAHQ